MLVRMRLFMVLALICYRALVASDAPGPLVDLVDVHSVEDITGRMPDNGLFDLRVKFAKKIDPALRTQILSEALSDQRASKIVRLSLYLNKLIHPPILTGLKNLKVLDLSTNELIESPVLTGLTALRDIDLHDNRLMQAPIVTGLPQLQKLIISSNYLVQPPEVTGLSNLKILGLGYNQLMQPPVLTGLKNIEWLSLEHNQLTNPPVLTGLINMKELLLGSNTLTQPPVLTGLINLMTLKLGKNELRRPPVLTGLPLLRNFEIFDNELFEAVVIPLTLARRINLRALRVPYVIEQLKMHGEPTALVDIATPGVDTVPFFFALETIARLPVPKRNPLTRAEILHTMNLVESWRYWRQQGMSAESFDARLREIEPVIYEENVYTVPVDLAREFMHERGLDNWQAELALETFDQDEINLTALLDQINAIRSTDSLLQLSMPACVMS